MISPYSTDYVNHYLGIQRVYPSVFSLKMFLGRHPNLDLRSLDLEGKTILDIGFGDGRDLILFSDLGLSISGVEVDGRVVEHTSRKLSRLGIRADLRVGINEATGFAPGSFDFVYSCAALMYLKDTSSHILSTLRHAHDLLTPGGYLLGTMTRSDSHITAGSKQIDKNRIVCKDPFFRQREGQLYWLHHSKTEVEDDLSKAGFSNCVVSDYEVDWFGTLESAFMFVAQK